MSNQNYPDINGIAPSWADIGITFTPKGGSVVEIADVAAIKGKRKADIGTQEGTGGRPMKGTTGKASFESSVTLYASGKRKLKDALIVAAQALGFVRGNQVLIGLVPFTIDVQWTPPGETRIYHKKIKGARIMEDGFDSKEGNEPEKEEVALFTLEIVDIVDGKEIVLI